MVTGSLTHSTAAPRLTGRPGPNPLPRPLAGERGPGNLKGPPGEAPGLGRILYYVLHLARRTFGTPLDPVTWAELRRQRLPVPEDRLLKKIALHCLTALPDSEEFFGRSTAKWMAGVLLTEQSRARRLGRITLRFVGRERGVPSETPD